MWYEQRSLIVSVKELYHGIPNPYLVMEVLFVNLSLSTTDKYYLHTEDRRTTTHKREIVPI